MPESAPQSPSPFQHRAHRSRLDRVGVIVSGLCMVHCLAGLVLIGVLGIGSLGFGAGLLLNPAIHRFGLVAAVGIGAATIGANALRHGHRVPLLLGSAGLMLMAGAVLSHHGPMEAVMTIAGVLLVASAHIINMRRPLCC
eukprot:gene6070-6145_t